MKTIGAVVAAAVLLACAAAGRTAEPTKVLEPLPPGTAAPIAGPAAATCGTCNTCNACQTCDSCGGGRLRAWLTYRPLHRTECGECRSCCGGRWVPLYLYFIGNCKEHPCTACGSTGPACGCAGPFGAPTGCGCLSH